MAEAEKRGGVFLGACGFSYDEWEGLVFPPGTPKNARISSYARQFRLVELDSTYYGTPRPEAVLRWAEQTPDGFVFAAKVPKQVTQDAKLAGPTAHAEMARFIATMKLLGPRLGPLLLQMSPGFRYPRDFKALKEMLEALPSLGGEGVRFAIEFRHPSWLSKDEPAALLREHGVAWAWNDWLPTEKYLAPMPRAIDEPKALITTADDFAYMRLIGNHALPIDYRTITVDRFADLVKWAELALEFRRGREDRGIYILLNNHYSGSSPATIRELERVMGLPIVAFGPDEAAMTDDPSRPRLPGL
jgi:uncharacterized protein YecE (DUF72 family)